jgi:hypothetical protein
VDVPNAPLRPLRFVGPLRSSLLNISPLGYLLPYVVSAEAAYMMRLDRGMVSLSVCA